MIAELTLGGDGIGELCRDCPDAEVVLEHLDGSGEGLRCVLTVVDGEPSTVRDCLRASPVVSGVSHLAVCPDGDRWRVTHAPGSPLYRIYEEMVAADGILLGGSGRRDGLAIRVWFPDREPFEVFRATVADLEPAVGLAAVSSGHPTAGDHRYGLSDAQHELLLAALERGYFEVPRETTLRELAADFGVSSQAASERLRRGLASLLGTTMDGSAESPGPGSFRS